MPPPPTPPSASPPRQSTERDDRGPSTAEPSALAAANSAAASTASHASSSSDPPMPTTGLAVTPPDPGHKSNRSSSYIDRPGMGGRKPSGTIIIPRDSPTVEVKDEQYDEGDARAMSPRRSSNEIERMGDEAREALEEQARALQANLLEIVDRIETVKSEHEKLEGGNKFLQSYIGELMQTSNLTAAGAGKSKSKGRSSKTK